MDFVSTYAEAAERFAAAITHADLDAPVPTCPPWTTYDLIVHLGNVHSWARLVVESRARRRPTEDRPSARTVAEAQSWYAARAAGLLDVLGSCDAEAECWNFSGINTTCGFWPRRQTHETLVHLVDLEQATGRTTVLDPAVCTDGVAEVLEVFLPRMHQRGHPADLTEPLTIATTDTHHVWTLHPRHDGPPFVAVRTEPGADLVEGTAEALLRVLWKRDDAHHVERVGNHERIDAFLASRLVP